MKTKLLKKARRKIKLHERNGVYYVYSGDYLSYSGTQYNVVLKYYRISVLRSAREIFGFKPKATLFKY